jgi:hypothetical protein
MTRRALLSAMFGAVAADPERLLWTPGARFISIPKPSVPHRFVLYYLNDQEARLPHSEIAQRYLVPAARAIGDSIERCHAIADYDLIRDRLVLRVQNRPYSDLVSRGRWTWRYA